MCGLQGMHMSDWRNDLSSFLKDTETKRRTKAEGSEAARFIAETAAPALEELRTELEKHGREATVRETDSSATIIVYLDGDEEITYRVQFRSYPDRVIPYAEIRVRERKGLRLVSFESMFRSGKPDYRMADISREEIIRHFLDHYRRRARAE
jgi:hypothetical protein